MSLSIIAKGLGRELPGPVAEQLLQRLEKFEVLADLTQKLTKARAGGARYQPSGDEPEILFRVLDVWNEEVGEMRFPAPAKVLRYALFDELGAAS